MPRKAALIPMQISMRISISVILSRLRLTLLGRVPPRMNISFSKCYSGQLFLLTLQDFRDFTLRRCTFVGAGSLRKTAKEWEINKILIHHSANACRFHSHTLCTIAPPIWDKLLGSFHNRWDEVNDRTVSPFIRQTEFASRNANLRIRRFAARSSRLPRVKTREREGMPCRSS